MSGWLWLAATLAIGTLGGWLAMLVAMPLPWMLGPMLATTLLAIAGAPIRLPPPLRAVMVAVLGVMLGSQFTPELLPRLGDWAVSLSVLALYIAASGAAGFWFFRRIGRYDTVTSYFSAMPGGFSEMVLAGSEMGGDGRRIALVHATRVLLVVLALPFAFQIALGVGDLQRPAAGPAWDSLSPLDLLLLAGSGVLGYFAARLIRIPAAGIVGPMVFSAALHLSGASDAAPPTVVINIAQVVIGCSIGCRFANTRPAFLLQGAVLGAGATVILVAGSLVFAAGLHLLTGLSTPALILAYAPGGLAEMSLIALALGLDAAFVATHHIVRILMIVLFAPTALRRHTRRQSPGPPEEPGTRP